MENMKVFVFTIMIIISSNTIFFLFLDVFSSAVDRSWPSSKIAPVKKMHKLGENGFFRKP
jgi:hypothetical protein